jgi:DNA-directed RNA polymerase specialized sigma24 family protein
MIAMTIPLVAAGPCEIAGGDEWTWGDNPDLWIYRARTVALLRKYAKLSVEVGRLPSLLGREFFRTHVTSYHMSTFEDVVIFVHDVERSLERLDPFSQKLMAKIVLLEYTQEETARLMGCGLRTVERNYPEALDHLSDIFLRGGLLRWIEKVEPNPCQEVKTEENVASCWQDEE